MIEFLGSGKFHRKTSEECRTFAGWFRENGIYIIRSGQGERKILFTRVIVRIDVQSVIKITVTLCYNITLSPLELSSRLIS